MSCADNRTQLLRCNRHMVGTSCDLAVLGSCAHMLPNWLPHVCTCVSVLQVLMSPKDATGRDITWQNASALEGYVRRLSAVAVSILAG
jgi:hypothetical protein